MLDKHITASWTSGFHILSGGGGSQMPSIKMAGFAPCSRQTGLVRIAILCLCLLFVLATPARPQGSVGTFTTIDVPGAGTGVFQGTIGLSINAVGDIAGFYIVAPNVAHGFVRAAEWHDNQIRRSGRRHGHESGNLPGQHQHGGGYRGNVL